MHRRSSDAPGEQPAAGAPRPSGQSPPTISPVHLARRLALLPVRSKTLIMMGVDAVALPLCMALSVALRLGSVEAALGSLVSRLTP